MIAGQWSTWKFTVYLKSNQKEKKEIIKNFSDYQLILLFKFAYESSL